MKQFYTVVLDRLTDFKGCFRTEPYESGWADEVVAFVRVHEKSGRAELGARLQISPDGIEWVDEGAKANTAEAGVIFMRTTNFGGWLRIVIECEDDCKITTYLALKG
jgi:hypothetical protein